MIKDKKEMVRIVTELESDNLVMIDGDQEEIIMV